MSRYIDADKLKKNLKNDPLFPVIENYGIIRVIDAQPTADVVEVVRCKDCKWKQGSECVRFAEVRPFPDDFCNYGERAEQ